MGGEKRRKRDMTFVGEGLTKLAVILIVSRIVRSYELLSVGDEGVPFIIDICKLYETKSIIFLYGESIKGTYDNLFHESRFLFEFYRILPTDFIYVLFLSFPFFFLYFYFLSLTQKWK